MDFSSLKNRSGKSSLEKLTQELTKLTQVEGKGADNRFWYPATDKAGNGYAVIRFLPAPGTEELPFIRMFEHGFKGPTGLWYIENSLTTIGKNDPVGEMNSRLWNSTTDDESPMRKQARAQKRKLNYISNIYIIQDQTNPENNGQVRLFKFGKKIFDRLNETMNPQFVDEKAMNPFDLWEGANFKLKIRMVEGYRNYDKSEFAGPEPLFDDDKKLEAVWKSEHALQPFLATENFKSYDELTAKLNRVLGLEGFAARQSAAAHRPVADEDVAPRQEPKTTPFTPVRNNTVDADDDDLSFFQRLAD